MRYGCRTILFVLFLYAPKNTAAQQSLSFAFRHLTQANGLLHNQVLAITQDDKGFIWIITPEGLQRYDGYRFTFYPEKLSTSSTGFGIGTTMCFDKQKTLWINNYTNLESRRAMENTWTLHAAHQTETDAVYHGYPGIEWRSNRYGLYTGDSATGKPIGSSLNILPPNCHRADVTAEDSTTGDVWFTTHLQLICLNRKTKKVFSVLNNPAKHPLLNPAFFTLSHLFKTVMIDSRKNIWVSTWSDVLYRYAAATKIVVAYPLSVLAKKNAGFSRATAKPLVNSILEDNHGTVWIGTQGCGLLRYNEAKDAFDYCVSNESNPESLQYRFDVFTLFQDREENFWVGTDKGISIFNPYREQYTFLKHEEGNNASLPNAEINAFIEAADGHLYVGTWGSGMAKYDSFFHFKKNISFTGNSDKNKIWCFLQSDERTLWIGAQHGYLLLYDVKTGRTKTLLPPEMENSTIRCMRQDAKGNIWLGLHNGKMVEWERETRRFRTMKLQPSDSLSATDVIQSIYIDKAQDCWVATKAGFKHFDLQQRLFTHTWLPDEKNSSAITSAISQGIEELNDSILLITTHKGGLNFFNKKKQAFTALMAAHGLPANTLYAIKKGPRGELWFTTNFGLYSFRPADKHLQFQNRGVTVSSPFSAPQLYTLNNGMWATYSSSEVVFFSPLSIQQTTSENSNIEITGLSVFGRPLPVDSVLSLHNGLTLSYAENFFNIEFAALNFSSPQAINYSYRLNGVDKEWVTIGNRHTAVYTDLKPGRYRFMVRAGYGDGTGPVTSLAVTITPPLWKSAWFITAVSLFFLSLIYGFIRWREKNIRMIAAEKLKVEQLGAEKLKAQLELEQIINYFSTSLIGKATVDDVLWDVAKNLIGRLGFVDCMIYLWNKDKTRMIQKAGVGPKGSIEEIEKQIFDVASGQGVVGYVMQTAEPVMIADTSMDARYRADERVRLSELAVPVIYNNSLIGVIDSEHHQKNFFTSQHLQLLNTIATLMANKIKSIEADDFLRQTEVTMSGMNEQLSHARLEALRSQMNPHFIFNCINSIDALIHSNDKYGATVYLNKFAKLLRNILDGSRQNVVLFSKDLDTLKLYVELEELRNESKFKTTFSVADDLYNSDYKVPPLIIQPFVENAILHGLKNKPENEGLLTIAIKNHNGNITYRITDNGIGREAAGRLGQNKETHYGEQIGCDRIKLFNKEETASVRITDLFAAEKPAGTEVYVTLKMSQ